MKALELLLLQDVAKLGKKGKIVKVKPGYGRNYLIPQGFATIATKESLRMIEIEKKRSVQQEKEKLAGLRQVAQELELTACTLESKANEDGQLFGSVTYSMIAENFKSMGFEVDADNISLEDPTIKYPIKELGIFTVCIKLHSEVEAKSKVWVVNEQEQSE